MITIFTPSFADAANTNAQNLTVKEVVARLTPEEFRVRMFCGEAPDERIAVRPNTELVPWRRSGNTARSLVRLGLQPSDVYFFPREGPLDAAFLRMRRSFRIRTALVTYVVSSQDRGDTNPLLACAIREGDAVVGNSGYVSTTIAEGFHVQTHTIHDGIARETFFPPPQPRADRGPLIVIYAGSFQPLKRVRLAIEEASRRPDVQFRLAGQGVEENASRKLVEQLGCRNVEFLGHLSQSQLGEEMRRADIFFFPSEREGHPQVLGQAAACGLPCVAMNLYRPDYVVDGQTGFLAATDEELSGKLGVLLAQGELRRSMSEAAVRHAARFDWDAVAREWEQVFERAVARRRSFLGIPASGRTA